jgi:hypothetical protein
VNLVLVVWSVFCVAGLALAIRSAAVVRRVSPWTMAGWLGWAAFFVLSLVLVARPARSLRFVGSAALLGVMVAWIVAGLRDERQPEPF